MADVIKHKRGTSTPAAGDLIVGELALNTTTGAAHTKTDGGAVATLVRRYQETFTASNGKTVTHNLGVQYVHVQVFDSSGNLVVVGVTLTSASALTLNFTGTLTNAVVVVMA